MLVLRHMGQGIAHEVNPATLPGGIHHRVDGIAQPLAGVADDQFHPIQTPILQLSASFVYSFSGNETSLPMTLYPSEIGWSFNVSAAWDIGKHRNRGLLGLKYTYAGSRMQVSGANQVSSLISIFARYAFRHKNSGTIQSR